MIRKALGMGMLLLVMLGCQTKRDTTFKPQEIYRSEDLVITQISKNTFEHTSFLSTQDFGNVPANGLVVRDANEVVIFDTPATQKSAEELMDWVEEELQAKINAVIPTHFHADCLGGLEAFHERGIPSHAYFKTLELAKERDFVVPLHAFEDSLTLKVGEKQVTAAFMGEGHTTDNVIGYFPDEDVLFGGCLIKEVDAEEGNLEDANLANWSPTVRRIQKEYPRTKIVIPGHGAFGDQRLLEYTADLFNQQP